jgi:hypothetical protein
VPQLYLRHFAQASKGRHRLYEYNLTTFRQRITAVEDTALESNYYDSHAESGEVESIDFWLKQLEDDASPVLERFLAAKSADGLSEEDRYLLSLFFVTLSMRVPAMRNVYRKAFEPMLAHLKMVEARFGRFDEHTYRQLNPGDDEVARTANELTVDTAMGMANLVFVRHWVLCETSEELPFVTSDNPIVRENRFPDGTFGMMSRGLQLALPLNPTTLLLIYDRRNYPPLRTDRPIKLYPDEVRFYNFTQVEQAARFLLSRGRECESVFRQWKEETANLPLTWERLIRRGPRLEQLRREMLQHRDSGETLYFCSHELWYGDDAHKGYGQRIAQLVGEDADTHDPVLRTAGAFQLAVSVLSRALPYCRNCTWSEESDNREVVSEDEN